MRSIYPMSCGAPDRAISGRFLSAHRYEYLRAVNACAGILAHTFSSSVIGVTRITAKSLGFCATPSGELSRTLGAGLWLQASSRMGMRGNHAQTRCSCSMECTYFFGAHIRALRRAVMGLFHPCRPNTVVRSISAAVIDTLKRHFFRTRSHVCQERLKGLQPAIANLYSPSSIPAIHRMGFFSAALSHLAPYAIDRMPRKTVRASSHNLDYRQ